MPLTDLFLATDTELRAYYPSYRAPLDEPRRVMRKNPFTGEPREVLDWDPTPGVEVVEQPRRVGPPEPSFDVRSFDVVAMQDLVSIVLDCDASMRCTPPALIGPSKGPWIFAVRGVAEIASLDDAQRARVATQITKRQADSVDPYGEELWREYVDVVVDAARRARAETRNVYVWLSL